MKSFRLLKLKASTPAPRQQQGVILIVALIVLVALSLASVGLLRSVDTATSVGGNLAIKKDIYRLSNLGLQQAAANLSLLTDGTVDNAAANYYATSTLPVDVRGIPQILVNASMPSEPGVGTGWAGELVLPVAVDGGTGITEPGGYVFRYVAERLCPLVGEEDPTSNPCRTAAGVGSLSLSSGLRSLRGGNDSVYVRVTWRVDGPKNATSYFQSMLL